MFWFAFGVKMVRGDWFLEDQIHTRVSHQLAVVAPLCIFAIELVVEDQAPW